METLLSTLQKSSVEYLMHAIFLGDMRAFSVVYGYRSKVGALEAGLPGLESCSASSWCAAEGNLPDLSVPQFSHLQGAGDNSASFKKLL